MLLLSAYSQRRRKCFAHVSLILLTTSCLLKWHNSTILSLPLFWKILCEMFGLKLLFLSKSPACAESGYKRIRTLTSQSYKPWFAHLLLITNFKNVSWYDPATKEGIFCVSTICFALTSILSPSTSKDKQRRANQRLYLCFRAWTWKHHQLNSFPRFTSPLKPHCFSKYL